MSDNRRIFAMIAGAVLMAGLWGAPAAAQQPSAAALSTARELVEIRGAANMFDTVLAGVIDQGAGLFLQSNPTLGKDLHDVSVIIRGEMASQRTQMVSDIARVYAQRFSEAELKDVVAFYKTPVGRKMLSEEPGVVDQTMQLMQQWANNVSEKILDRFRAEMKKKGHNL